MSANPYEIRQGLLGQAEHILNTKYESQQQQLLFLLDRGVLNPKTVTWPEPPTTEEIINEAEKLYQFIQTK